MCDLVTQPTYPPTINSEPEYDSDSGSDEEPCRKKNRYNDHIDLSDDDDTDEDPDFYISLAERKLIEEEDVELEEEVSEIVDESLRKLEKTDGKPASYFKLMKFLKEAKFAKFSKLVIADNYYGSLKLLTMLEELGFNCVTCVRMNQDKDLKQPVAAGLRKGEVRNIYHKDLPFSYCVWYDSKIISFVSNCTSGLFSLTKTKKKKEFQYPEIAKIYNKYMNFVDQYDSYLKSYWNQHKRQKWTQTLFYGFIKMVTVNTFIQYASVHKCRDSYEKFLGKLLAGLVNYEGTISNSGPIQLVYNTGNISVCSWCRERMNKRSRCRFFCSCCKIMLHAKCFDHHLTEVHMKK